MVSPVSSWSIRRRLVIIILTIAALTLAAVTFIALRANASSLRWQTEQAFTSQNQTVANELDTDLQGAVATARALAAALDGQTESPISQIWTMASRTLIRESIPIRRINVFAPFKNGFQVIIFNAPNPPSRVAPMIQIIDPDIASDEWFLLAMADGKERWHGPAPAFDGSAGQPVVSYAVPFTDPGRQNIGVVWVDVPVTALNRMLDQVMGSDQGRNYSLLVTDADQVAAAFRMEQPMSPEASATLSAFMAQSDVTDMRERVEEDKGLFIIGRDPMKSDQEAVILMNRLPVTGWQLMSFMPGSALQNPFDRNVAQMAGVGLVGMIALGAIAYLFVGRSVSKPLEQLGSAARNIGSGDMRFEIGYRKQRDEIGQLATAMEDMKDNLEYSYRQLSNWSQTLEKRVAQRTEELEIAQRIAAEQAAELQAVYDASLSVVSDYKLETMLQRLTENILTLMETRYCAVWLLTPDRQRLQLVANTSQDKSRINMIIGADEGLVGAALRDEKLLIVEDYTRWPGRIERAYEPTVQRAMATPLMFHKKPIGAVMIGRTQEDPPFSEPEQRLLTLFANLVSPVVRNAQLLIQREDAMRDAERANSVKTRFLASVTHELRTPLNLIINNLDFWRIGMFGQINDDQRTRLDQTVRSAEHLLALINDLLDVSKIEAGQMELMIRPADLRPVLEDAYDSAEMLLESTRKPIKLEANIPDHLPQVPMDPRRIRQVVTNLLTNAVKFTQQGQITLDVRVKPEFVDIAVIDTGIGIPPEEMDRLFEAFERTERARNLGIEGTGLGLPISRYLVEAHGGRFSVESQVGRGSVFAFTLPLANLEPELVTAGPMPTVLSAG